MKNLFNRPNFINSHQNRFQLIMNHQSHFCTVVGKMAAKTIYLVWAKMKQDVRLVVVVVVVVVVGPGAAADVAVVTTPEKQTKTVELYQTQKQAV